MSVNGQWFCPTCGHSVDYAFCQACGERKPHPDELTFKGLAAQAFDAFTSWDSRLWQTLHALILRPGSLSLMYLHGSRKPYIGPFALFLFANVFFVGMEAITGSNIFATSLQTHMGTGEQPWSAYAQEVVPRRLAELHTTMEDFVPLFDSAVALHAKSLIVLMVLPFALLPLALFAGSRQPFAAHLAFSLHFHGFLLVLLGIAVLIPWVDLLIGGPGMSSRLLDNGIAVGLLLVSGTYLYIAAGTVYAAHGVLRMIKTALLVSAAMSIYFGYRFLLFILTLYTA